VAEYCQSRTQK